jgi:hypothetical protein
MTLTTTLPPLNGAALSPGFPASSATAHMLDELALYGLRPGDEPDTRPLPEADDCRNAVADTFDVLTGMFADTRLEDDVEDLLWSVVNVFHRKIDRVQRRLDGNEDAQRGSQREQDGTEVKSVELERLIAQGMTMLEQRNAFEFLRDTAADLFEAQTGSAWRPYSGSKVSRTALTAAVIDSRDYLAAKRRSETEIFLPEGARIAVTGGVEYQDHNRIWAVLDKVKTKHPDLVLLHGGSPRGAELIAAKWADNRGVAQVVFKPDWNRHKNAAPFKRNDTLLDTMPIGVVAFPGSGITDNLVDKAKRLGIRIGDFRDPR